MGAVHVGRVEQGHPGVEGGVEGLAGLGRIHRAADVVEAEADDGDDEPGPAERAIAHEITLCEVLPGAARGLAPELAVQTAVWPPSTTSVCPVMNDDASLARNTAGPAISSALAHRPIGIVEVRPA